MTTHPASTFGIVSGIATRPRTSWLRRVLAMVDTRRSRIDLSHLSDDQLHDIGLTRDQVEQEINKPIWDVPAYWRRS